jgi:serine/threonine protein kinase
VLVDVAGQARLTDFGLALVLNATAAATGLGSGGSLRWMAPELLLPEQYQVKPEDEGKPTKESDLYALAITVWEVRLCCIATMPAHPLLDIRGRYSISALSSRGEYHLESTGWCTTSAARRMRNQRSG